MVQQRDLSIMFEVVNKGGAARLLRPASCHLLCICRFSLLFAACKTQHMYGVGKC